MKTLSLKKLIQKQAEQIRAIYDEYIHTLSDLRKKHFDEFASFARKLEQQKIDRIREQIK